MNTEPSTGPESSADYADGMDTYYSPNRVVVKIGDHEYDTGAIVTGQPGEDPDCWIGIVDAITSMVVGWADDPEQVRDHLRSFAV